MARQVLADTDFLGAVSVPDATFALAKLAALAGVSVPGRSANSSGAMAAITAGANDVFLRRVSDALGFGGLTIGMVPDGLLTYAKLASAAIAADSDVHAASASKLLTAAHLASAAAEISLGSNTIAIDWAAGINYERTLTGNGTVSNPTNGQAGTFRQLRLLGNSGTDRSITSWGSQFSAQGLPTLTDIDNTQQYLVTLRCVTSTWFKVVNAERIDPP